MIVVLLTPSHDDMSQNDVTKTLRPIQAVIGCLPFILNTDLT